MTTRRDLIALAESWLDRGDLMLTASECAAELTDLLTGTALPQVSQCATVTFDDFWSAYPNRRAKKDAQKAWDQVGPDDDLARFIIRHLEDRVKCDAKWRDGIIPLPATFLRGERWNDEYERGPEVVRRAPDRVRSERDEAAARALAAVRARG